MNEKTDRFSEQLLMGRLKTVIVILVVLIVLSAAGLAGRIIYINYFYGSGTTVVLPDNLIGESTGPSGTVAPAQARPRSLRSAGAKLEEPRTDAPAENPEATVLSLFQGKPSDNEPFEVRNMFPGDTEVRYYCVKANHREAFVLYFDAEVTEQTQQLGDVLQIKITHLDTGVVLYEGSFNQMQDAGYSEQLPKSESNETLAYYKIEVSMPTSAGNEYQVARLKADFKWYVENEDVLVPPPVTGDSFHVVLWATLLISSGALIIILLFARRRNKEEEEAYEA